MIREDRILGHPLRAFRGTEVYVESISLVAVDEGCFAYSTDTHRWGTFDGTSWTWGAGGGAQYLDDLLDVNVPAPLDGQSLVYDAATTAWDAETLLYSFLSLIDTPSSYSGQADRVLRVASGEVAVEFDDPVIVSAGATDSGELATLDATGKWDISLIPAGGGGSTTVDMPLSVDLFIELNQRQTEEDFSGGLLSLITAQALSLGVPINVTIGIGKIVVIVNAGADVSGTITVTGTTVDRNTGVETPADTDSIVVDVLTTDNSSTDADGNVIHDFVGAYITSKWFKGAVTLSTADLNLSDADVWHCSFEQVNDESDLTLTTFDANVFVNNVNAELHAHLYILETTTGDKCDITNEESLEIDGGTATANRFYRLRRGQINKALDGSTDGFWVDLFMGPVPQTYIEDLSLKVWFTVAQEVSATLDHSTLSNLDVDDHDTLYMLNWDNVLVVHPAGATRVGQYYNTIAAALAAASSGDMILVMPGTYAEDITLVAGVTVMGLSRDDVIISGAGGATTVTVSAADAVLANLTVSISVNLASVIGVAVGAGGTGFIMRDVTVLVVNAGAAAFGFAITLATTATLYNCNVTATATVAYGAYNNTAGATMNIIGGEYVGSTTTDIIRVASGTVNIMPTRYGSISGVITWLNQTSVTKLGVVELATTTETQAGTDTARANTPAGLRADVPATPAASRGVRLDANSHLIMPASGNVELNQGLLKVDGAADDNVWRIGEVVLDLDFTGTDFDTKVECQAQGLRFSDSDTPFPDNLVVATAAGSWTHIAGQGWKPSSVTANDGPGILIPLMRPGNWELEIAIKVPAQGVGTRGLLYQGYIGSSNHVGAYVRWADTSGSLLRFEGTLYSNDGDDTYTSRYSWGSIASGAGTWTVRFVSKSGSVGGYESVGAAYQWYEGRQSAGIAYTTDCTFLQYNPYNYPASAEWLIYIQSLKLTYLL